MTQDNSHIPTEEVEADIAITEREIEALQHDLESGKIRRDRWAIMKAETGIRQREDFILKLKNILKTRS